MPYDKNICDNYVDTLENVNAYKSKTKEVKKMLENINEIVCFLSKGRRVINASLMVQRELNRSYNSLNVRLIDHQKSLKKATKIYQKYCANKESA